ncbi:uncharacterized protein LOC113859820 [Abrus precatorius]|uniref:Uncharacterized protein LOC113859820 n=1 Tax=Abrus precatorius TaxID=3816 RepID=A0A8B8KWL9_ABRPR|nr:uncharacterized protein LOC113859820 [Abrus precatorius]
MALGYPPFNPSRGARQGDPLAPFLFVLCMEKLPMLIWDKVNNETWKPIKISRGRPTIFHLFFANDCLFFAKASNSQVQIVKEVLDSFYLASRLRVNLDKAKFFASANVRRSKVTSLEAISRMKATTDLERYLGIPFSNKRVRKRDFQYIVDRVQNRLASPLAVLIPCVNIQDINLKVKDVYKGRGRWDWNIVATWLSDEQKSTVIGTFVDDSGDMCDEVIWGRESHGLYTCKSACKFLLNPLQLRKEVRMKDVWKLPLLRNILFFLWLSLLDALPTNKFDVDQRFQISEGKEWLSKWIFRNRSTLFCITLWNIRKGRNDLIFSKKAWNFNHILSKISLEVIEIQSVLGQDKTMQCVPHSLRWIPPPHGYTQLNSDGSDRGSPGLVGFGGLLRDNKGSGFLVMLDPAT